jgi:Polysaccharide deacetylase
MTGWTAPLRRRLDLLASAVPMFFRDDDAGRSDPQLSALVRVFAEAGTAVDVAAIPAAVAGASISVLDPHIDSGLVTVHQHGWAHTNHELTGRGSEFGASRAPSDQLADLLRGARVLAQLFQGRVAPFFTPPWNRCEAVTAQLLAAHGFTMLSCDRSAPCRGIDGLQELPVTVDWARQWRTGGRDAVCGALAAAIVDGELTGAPVGLMLHHAEMSAAEFVTLTDLLAVLRPYECVELTSMSGLSQLDPF